ncbi:MAG: CHASE2 domain-containing protein [Betaproteobacteria bacterium]|nr:CHASE2 domain-containing protein [Betaproteobacteria bacterium]
MKIDRRLALPIAREWGAIFLTLSALMAWAVHEDWLGRVDATLYGAALSTLERPPQADIVIVGIDDKALAEFGRWPWRRDLHGLLLDQIAAAGPKVIVFDVILSEPDRQFPQGDAALADAIRRAGRVVLPITMHAEGGRVLSEARPAPPFAEAAAALSHVSAPLDADGMLRGVFLRGGLGAARHDLSPLAALRLAEPGHWPATRSLPGVPDPLHRAVSRAWLQDHWYRVPFAGPPGHFPAVSYVDVFHMTDAEARKAFAGKFVLVGATAPALTDAYPTPVSGGSSAMAGIEIQANVLQSLREGMELRQAGRAWTLGIALALLLATMALFPFAAPRVSLVAALAMAIAVLGLSLALLKGAFFWWPPAVAFVALLLAYPLWSWRKLEATQRYLNEELARLDREPVIVPFDGPPQGGADTGPRILPGLIEQRIAVVQVAAERLRNLNRFIAESIESLPDATLVTSTEGRVLLANSAADRLYKARRTSPEKAGGRVPDQPLEGRDVIGLLEKFSREGIGDWRATWLDAYEDTRLVSFEAKFEATRDFLIQIAPLFSGRGTQTGTIVTLVDISPLRESERRRDEALRFLSHDMRSPQASILTLLGMYQEDPDSMPVDKLTSRIEKYSRRTLNLADEFLRLAKAERARAEDFEAVDLAEIVRDAIDETWTLARPKRITIDGSALDACDGAWMRGDRDMLTRVMVNLLSNAVKYSPPDTRVEVTLEEAEDAWQLCVRDQGYGIAQEDMDKLFTRFSRLTVEGQPEEEGIGLGLVFVKTVVERHGGTIAVDSRTSQSHPGRQGTAFTLEFPRGPEPG